MRCNHMEWVIEETNMGTLSKRRIEDFGIDIKSRIEELRRGVGKKLDDAGSRIDEAHRPGSAIARGFERVASALPPSGWIALAGASALGSFGLRLARRSSTASFVAAWVPTFLVLGLYPRTPPVSPADRHDIH
jgi:hypothetical protein